MPVLTIEQQEEAFALATAGTLIKRIRSHFGFDSHQWYKFVKTHPQFETELNRARIHGFEELAESILEIPDKYFDPQQAKVAFECLKAYLAWMDPAKYGAKIDLHVTQTLDITAALDASRRRLERSVEPLALKPSDSDELW